MLPFYYFYQVKTFNEGIWSIQIQTIWSDMAINPLYIIKNKCTEAEYI